MRVSVLGAGEKKFVSQLERAGADVSTRKRKGTDLFFLSVESHGDMKKLAPLEPLLVRDGAIWVIHPKGRRDVSQGEIIKLGVKAGFVDNKVSAFSETHTALRFVIPKSRR
ncbi:MAG: hypothetical protein WD050_05260 [Actinomycetota bacterium]